MKCHITKLVRDNRAGFSLVEVAMALAIMGFACVSLIGMIPIGITSFHQAMGNTVESEVVQNLSNDILLASFNDLYQYNGQSYYYDADGSPLTSASGAVYTATVGMVGLDSTNSPLALTNNGVATTSTPVNTSAYRLTITITCINNPLQPHLYPLIIANNNQ